ncbi:MAG: tetratricopeptide repeat protein [Desulfobulbaceae bacterium]|nr:tetratricopeptide repeat protein [Desulfobulbaceae bacterium]
MSNDIPTANEVEDDKDEKEQAKADYRTGMDFLKKGDLTLAAYAFHNALMGYQQLNDEHGVANAADKLADICLEREEYPQALNHIEISYAICEKEEDQSSLISLRRKIARAKTGMGKLDEAGRIYLDLIDYYEGSRNPKGTVEVVEKLAEIYLLQGDTAAAADAYRTVASIHANFNHKAIAAQYLEKATVIESGAGVA